MIIEFVVAGFSSLGLLLLLYIFIFLCSFCVTLAICLFVGTFFQLAEAGCCFVVVVGDGVADCFFVFKLKILSFFNIL